MGFSSTDSGDQIYGLRESVKISDGASLPNSDYGKPRRLKFVFKNGDEKSANVLAVLPHSEVDVENEFRYLESKSQIE